ncbi:MAG: M12 family metallo-peptidase [Ignavibacteria bacterium]|nr:M12 family metallo-peptidase [Ignavibacteria bacterium]
MKVRATSGALERKHVSVVALLTAVMFVLASVAVMAQVQVTSSFKDVPESALKSGKGARYIIPEKYRTVVLNTVEFAKALKSAPMEIEGKTAMNRVEMSFPLPDGTSMEYYVTESPIMAPELAAQYPELKTYSIEGKELQAGSGRIDFTPLGFHAIIFTPAGTVYIDPYRFGEVENYISYYMHDYINPLKMVRNGNCVLDDAHAGSEIESLMKSGAKAAPNNQLRTYRLALAADAEYTAFYGGTVAGALNGMVVTMNRVNGVYIRELSIKMVMVANTSSLIYTNSSTDPYTNDDGQTMLSQNQTTVDNIIGSANYDIGHVFSTGGGGIAMLGAVCRSGYKAQGVTGSPQPVGDGYDIDYVAHEMGHEFGANHPFNGNQGSCSGGNRNSSTAYEPGSGTTIMAYAGICLSNDLQPHSDPYFHIVNLEEIATYTISGSGNSCPVITTTGNTPPVVTMPQGGLTIPMKTPFALTGSATDANNDTLTYCWEEYDLGSAGSPTAPSGNAPIFRSFNPVASPTRTFPKLSDLLNNTSTIGEILPTYTRTLTFRLTARDNKATGGSYGYGSVQYSVTANAGPFVITSPNTNVAWDGNNTHTISWNVANTNVSPVNCTAVNIYLSTDGGTTWPIVLAQNAPNTGNASVMFPNLNITTARVKVAAANSIFFDISDVNFRITPGGNTLTVPSTVKTGWNMVSIPVFMNDMTSTVVYSGANSLVYGFSGAYSNQLALTNGKGYWVRYGADASLSYTGTATGTTSIPLVEGWNMIGPYNVNAAISNVTTTPAGIVNSSFYGYDNGYNAVTTMVTGQGYWVRATQAGTLNLNTLAKDVVNSTPKIEKSWSKVSFSDAAGNTSVLYLASAGTKLANYDLPPVPPTGIFDARFSSQRYVEVANKQLQSVQISGASYPVTVTAGATSVVIRDKATQGKVLAQTIAPNQSVVLTNSGISEIELGDVTLPLGYELAQNYPNPFNPSTTLRFGLPKDERVTLTIYNQLGQKVDVIELGQMSAGYHSYDWKATHLVSGVYFYEMRAGSYSAVKKMVLMK